MVRQLTQQLSKRGEKMRRPKNKHELKLYFDTKIGIDNFTAWYLDGGGEQQSKYYSKKWGKDWIQVEPSEGACPECEHDETETTNSLFYKDRNLRIIEATCSNCGHFFDLKSPYVKASK